MSLRNLFHSASVVVGYAPAEPLQRAVAADSEEVLLRDHRMDLSPAKAVEHRLQQLNAKHSIGLSRIRALTPYKGRSFE